MTAIFIMGRKQQSYPIKRANKEANLMVISLIQEARETANESS